MSSIKEIIDNVKVLYGWDGANVLPEIEENPEDISVVVRYCDHGDEFLVIKTRDGKTYEYGCYENRPYGSLETFVRTPHLYKQFDEYSSISNKIYYYLLQHFRTGSESLYRCEKKYNSATYAQIVFDDLIEFISDLTGTSKAFFDCERYKDGILNWLKLNGIATKENVEKLASTPFHNKVGEYKVVGIAGKKDVSGHGGISADSFDLVYANGEKLDPRDYTEIDCTDEWGVETYYLDLDSLEKGA